MRFGGLFWVPHPHPDQILWEKPPCVMISPAQQWSGDRIGRPVPGESAVVNQKWKGAEARWEERLLRGCSQAGLGVGGGGVNTSGTVQTLALVHSSQVTVPSCFQDQAPYSEIQWLLLSAVTSFR